MFINIFQVNSIWKHLYDPGFRPILLTSNSLHEIKINGAPEIDLFKRSAHSPDTDFL